MTVEEWMFFMAIWIAASLPLGPNALNCVATSAALGFRFSLWSVLGVTLAAIIHMSIALTGIATFMNANPVLFEALRWLGVGYLAWMGIAMFRQSASLSIDKPHKTVGRAELVRRAIVISLSNPKAIFTWMAVFTQFIDPGIPLAGQLLVLAPSALSVTVLVYGGYCLLGLGVKRIFAGHRKRWFDRLTGATYFGFAALLSLADLKRN